MIYDTFLYNGEKEMLELRMKTLSGVVDQHIAVTGRKTFRGVVKEDPFRGTEIYYSGRNPIKFVDLNLPSFYSPWLSETIHRDHALTGIPHLKEDDIVLIGDVDEIPDPDHVGKTVAHRMDNYWYSTKYIKTEKWIGTVGVRGMAILNGMMPSYIRSLKDQYPVIDGGWHLSYFFMDPVQVADKIRSFSHSEFDRPEFTDLESILTRMNQGLDLFDRGTDCVRLETPSDYLPEALKASPREPVKV